MKARGVKARSAGTGSLSPGNRPWPGITGPDCWYCSWAYRGPWPFGRMEIKYLNSFCLVRAHRMHGVETVAGGSEVG